MPDGDASVFDDDEKRPALSAAEQRRERARQRRRQRPPEKVAADAARAHARYMRRLEGMTPAEREAARARARARYHGQSPEERTYLRESRRAAVAARAARASVAEQADDAERRDARADVFRRLRARHRDAAERELLSEEAAARLEAEHIVGPLDTALVDSIYQECRERLGWEGMGEAVCGVCQLLVPAASTVALPPSAWPLAAMTTRLRPADDLPTELVKQYDLSSVFPLSRNMLLSPLGVVRGTAGADMAARAGGTGGTEVGTLRRGGGTGGTNDNTRAAPEECGTSAAMTPCASTTAEAAAPAAASAAENGCGAPVASGVPELALSFCATCLASLQRPNRNGNPPRLALANGNATGRLPDNLRDSTSTEFNLVSTVSVRAAVTFLRGGGQAALRAHTLLIDTRPTPPAAKLPRVLGNSDTDGIVRVVFTSHLSTAQEDAARRTFLVRRRRVTELLEWLQANNHLYENVAIETAAVSGLPGAEGGEVPEGLFIDAHAEDGCSTASPGAERGASPLPPRARDSDNESPAQTESCDVQVVQNASVVIQGDQRTDAERVEDALQGTIRVKRTGPVMRDGDDGGVEAAFVRSFPFGRGGPSEKRKVHLAEAEVMRRLMMDGYREFGRNQLLLVYAFDRVARGKMLRKGCLRLQRSPEDVGLVSHVTEEELRRQLLRDERRKRRRAAGIFPQGGESSDDGAGEDGHGGRPARKRSRHDCHAGSRDAAEHGTQASPKQHCRGNSRSRVGGRRARTLLRIVSAAAGAYDGSNEQRQGYRQEAYAMCNHFGLPQLFFTFSPNDVGSATLWYYAGVVDDDIFTSFNVGHLLNKSDRFRTLARDPVAGARYFRRLSNVVVEVLIGWCELRGRPRAQGGAFGTCKGFYGAIEAQARGSPHIHMLIWLYGHAPSAQDFVKLIRDDEQFRKRWWAWAEDLVHADLPTSTEGVECPECSGSVAAVTIPPSFRGVQPQSAVPPAVAACQVPTCGKRLTSADVLEQQQARAAGVWRVAVNAADGAGAAAAAAGEDASVVGAKHAEGGETRAPLIDEQTLDTLMATPVLPAWTAATGHLQYGHAYESSIAMATQIHSHKHAPSCFKRTRAGRPRECRYGFPREPRKEAEVEDEGGFLARRPVGCEYVNPHVRLVLLTARCNSDVRILQATDVVMYTVKYALKPMADDERDAIHMLHRFQRVLNAEQVELPRTELGKATRRVCALAYAATERQEMPATLAALFLLYKDGNIASHQFVPLVMPQLLAFHEGTAAATAVVPVARTKDAGALGRADTEGEGGLCGELPADTSVEDADAVLGEDLVPVDPDESQRADGPQLFVLMSQTLDYRLRPEELSHLSPYEMYEQYEKRRIPRHLSSQRKRGAASRAAKRINQDDADGASDEVGTAEGGGCETPADEFMLAGDRRRGRGGTATGAPFALFLHEHPQHTTHHLVRCDPQRVPRIVGPRLPDRSKLDDDADARELYGAFALVVFMPWRARGDLRPDTDASWWAAFKSTEMTPYAVKKLQTFQSWHDGCAKPKQRAPSAGQGEADGDSDVGDGNSFTEGSEISGAVSIDPEAGHTGDNDDSPPLDFVGCLAVDDGGVEMLPSRGRICVAAERAGVIGAVARAHSTGTAAKCGVLTEVGGAPPTWSSESRAEPLLARVALAARGAIVGGVGASAKELDVELQAACQARRTCEEDALPHGASLRVGGDETGADGFGNSSPVVSVERLQALHVDALGLKSSADGATLPVLEASAGLSTLTAPMPGLDASIVAAVFTLNAEQRRAFGACAATLSAQWAKGLRNLEALDSGAAPSRTFRRGVADQVVDTVGDGQLLMYLGGTAGSGKSRVIDAVRYFAQSWTRARSVTCAAPTGVAAANIDGSTLHTLLKLSLGGTTKKAPQSLVEFFTGVVLVIIDELSMISADFLAIIEHRLRQVGDAGAVFGGFSVVLCGDLQQLPPVVSTPLWTAGPAPVGGGKAEEERHIRRMRGVQLWRMFRTVVFLRQNMRQGDDPGFASLCDRLRDGTTTRADVDNINLHCLVTPKSPVALPLTGVDLFCPMIVATNASRIQVTQSVMRQCSRLLPASNKPVRHYPIVRIVKRSAEAVDRRLLAAAVEALPSSRTDNRDMVLEAFDGALLMVDQNVATEAGVANGSLVRLLCVHYPPGTTFSDVAVTGGGVMRVASDHADVLYVLPLQQPRAWKRLAGIPHWLPDETVPIVRKEARFSLKVDDVSVSVSALQFPVTPAFAMTTYKVQGKTTDAIILLEWSKLFVWCVAFVVFTRVRTMSNLFLGAPLSWEMAERCKPPPELGVELSRLRALEAAMLASGSGVVAPTTLPVGGAGRARGSPRRGLMADSILVGMLSSRGSSSWPHVVSAWRSFSGRGLIAAAAMMLLAVLFRVSLNDVLYVVICMNNWWWATVSSSCTSGPPMTSDDAAAMDNATSTAEAADTAVWPEARTGELHFVDAPPLASAVASADGLLAPVKQSAVALVATCLGLGAVGSGIASACEDDLLVYGPGNERITRRVLRRFAPGQWLSDENVNGVLSMLQVRNDDDVAAGRAVPVCLFLNSFFFDKLMSGRHRAYNFEAVRRWTATRDLRAVDLVMTVVKHGGGHGNHWTLAVIHTSTGTVEHFDSLGAHHPAVISSLSRWYQDAVRSGSGRQLGPAPSIDHGARAPQQRNGDDCGVFAVAVASALSRREPVGQVTAARTVYFRLRFAAELLVTGRHPRGFLSTSSVE